MELLIRKMGNSAGLTLPPALLRDLDFSVGQALLVERSGADAIVLRAKPMRKKYTAAELNKLCNLKAPMPADLQAWEDMPLAGDEAL
jgi:antitoxin component of MazEF toxin-antitoxin module